jgi:hypothetical protein
MADFRKSGGSRAFVLRKRKKNHEGTKYTKVGEDEELARKRNGLDYFINSFPL